MTSLTYGTLLNHFEKVNGVVPEGTVTLIASARRLLIGAGTPAPSIALPQPVKCIIDADGDLVREDAPTVKGALVLATDNPNANPVAWTWTAHVNTRHDGKPLWQAAFPIEVPGGQETYLSDTVPVESTPGVSILRGPQGERGEGLRIDQRVDIDDNKPAEPADGTYVFVEETGHLHLYTQGEYVDLGQITGPPGAQGPQGLPGVGIPGKDGADSVVPGPRGLDGKVMALKDSVATPADLPRPGDSAEAFMTTEDPFKGHMWVWDPALVDYTDIGRISGERGEQGFPGVAGPANTLAVASVTTGAPGTQATVTISGVAPNQWLEFVIPQGMPGADSIVPGPAGPANTLTIGTVTTGQAASATLTGDAPAQVLDLVLPAGPKGEDGSDGVDGVGIKGDQGDVGPANTLTIGTVTTAPDGAPAAATITGAAPAQVLDLTLPAGPAGRDGIDGVGVKGDTGSAGPANTLAIGAVTTLAPGTPATATVTGASPNQTLTLGIPQGAKGDKGEAGTAGTVPMNVLAVVKHLADPNMARPAYDYVRWIGTVQPVNMATYDEWFNPTGTN